VAAVLHHDRSDRRDLDDLVPDRLRVVAGQRAVAVPASVGS
jgi:hypothetical protein